MYYGFDIGGSKIALGVYDDARRLQWQTRVATPHDRYENFLDAISALVAEADRRFGARGMSALAFPASRKLTTACCMPPICPPPAAGR